MCRKLFIKKIHIITKRTFDCKEQLNRNYNNNTSTITKVCDCYLTKAP